MQLFPLSWPWINPVWVSFCKQDYRNKRVCPLNTNQQDLNRMLNFFTQGFKRVVALRKKCIDRHTQSELGLWDWWLSHEWLEWLFMTPCSGVTPLCLCWSFVFSRGLCERARPEYSCIDSPNQSHRPLECRVQETFWQRASLGALPRQRDWTGVMISIRQLYEYLWQTSAMKTLHERTQSWWSFLPQTGWGDVSQANRSSTADVWEDCCGVKGHRWRGVSQRQENHVSRVILSNLPLQGLLDQSPSLNMI